MAIKEVQAIYKMAPSSPLKVRTVVNQIRGKNVNDALATLQFSPRKAAALVLKTLRSAIANAEENNGFDADKLIVSTVYVDQAMRLKRMRPRAKGRGDRFIRPRCHITLKVSESVGAVRGMEL